MSFVPVPRWPVCSALLTVLCLFAGAASAQGAGHASVAPALDAGEYRNCALTGRGSLQCWGDANYGDYQPPAGNGFTGLSVGFDHACALRGSGQIACWGNPASIATPPPTGTFLTVAAGEAESCAIRSNGQLACWGGGLADTAPAGRFTDVTVYGARACAVGEDGALQCWQAPGIFGLGPAPDGRFLTVSVGQAHACALRSDGAVACWGANGDGQLAVPTGARFTALAAGYRHTCGLREDRSLACWGANDSGQASPPAGRFSAVTSGRLHSCAIDEDGAARCWGTSVKGAGTTPNYGIQTVHAGPAFGCGLGADGEVFCAGVEHPLAPPVRRYLDLSVGPTIGCGLGLDGRAECWGAAPDGMPADEQFRRIAVGFAHVCALRETDGSVLCWGDDTDGQSSPPAGKYVSVHSGDRYSCAIRDAQGARPLVCWGAGAAVENVPQNQYYYDVSAYGANVCANVGPYYKFCWGEDAAALQPPASVNLANYAVGARHACAISMQQGGRVHCWGDNSAGQLQVPADTGYYRLSAHGDTTCADHNDGMRCWGGGQEVFLPSPGPRMSTHGIAAGEAHSCTLRSNRGIGCWGDDTFGQASVPVHRASAVSANAEHSCSVAANGRPRCWGDDTHAGSTPPDQALRMLDAGQFNGCGVGDDGAAVCWGWDANGQTTTPAGLFRSVATGLNHSCGLRDDGTLQCWGYDAEGQAMPPAGTFRTVDVGERHSCAIAIDGTLQCWGLGSEGQTTPPDLPGATYRALAAGAFHNCAILAHGGLACWGRNVDGQASPPVEGRYLSVAAGAAHSCAVREDGVRLCWGANTRGQAPQVTVSPAVLPTFRNAAPWSVDFRLVAEGGYVPPGASFQLVDSTLPYGVYLTTSGQLRGQSSTTPGQYAFTIEGSDDNGFRATRQYTYTVLRALDTTPPYIEPQVNGVTVSREWYSGDFTLTWRVEDSQTPVTSTGCQSRTFSEDADPIEITCTATSEGGTTTRTIRLGRDSGAPETVFTQVPPAVLYSNDYYTSVTFAFASSGDDRSGVAGFECSFNGGEGSYFPCMSPYTTQHTAKYVTLRFHVRAVDAAGNVDPTPSVHEWTIREDRTYAVITPIPTGPLGDDGWYRGDLSLRWTAEDPESGVTILEGCQEQTFTVDTKGTNAVCRVRSAAGEAVRYFYVKRDSVAPNAAAGVYGTPNAAGWFRQDVTVRFACSDATSGTRTCPADQILSQEGVGVRSAVATAHDMAGNPGQSDTVVVNIDKTPPTAVCVPRTQPNANGWYNQDVVVDIACADSLSGIASGCTGPFTVMTEGTHAPGAIVYDHAGNSSQVGGPQIRLDRTPPTLFPYLITPRNAAGWYRTDVLIGYDCLDVLSGLASACPGLQTLTQEGSAVPAEARSISDRAGNTSTAGAFTVRIDKTPPTLEVTMPPAVLSLNSVHAFGLSASDALSGIASQGCSTFDTRTVGTRTVTCTATDRAGNVTTRSATYRVVYNFAATAAPLTQPGVAFEVRAPRSVVFDWRLFDANGAAASQATVVSRSSTVVACPATVVALTTAPMTSEQPLFLRLGGGLYRQNWWLDWTGTEECRRLSIVLDDGNTHAAIVKVVPRTIRTGGPAPVVRVSSPSPSPAPASRPPTPAGPARSSTPTPAGTTGWRATGLPAFLLWQPQAPSRAPAQRVRASGTQANARAATRAVGSEEEANMGTHAPRACTPRARGTGADAETCARDATRADRDDRDPSPPSAPQVTSSAHASAGQAPVQARSAVGENPAGTPPATKTPPDREPAGRRATEEAPVPTTDSAPVSGASAVGRARPVERPAVAGQAGRGVRAKPSH